ncbi:Oidioi.mRNA.OKI2018_I69.PAR.g11399.t1.cds [Oikopleura dioica]|uniref:Oidioi.mRNA.OKI2018_I69.PAR.g11399.t1.cds n=1 Tax=Oikopleura dioica TaxID=34765 RepID=A0ABN7RZK6_OIKDI|nr:Oidioi.mRNA.OKI2018_I69.PAR.g11399.t1.cds [Oikopleura dioica]
MTGKITKKPYRKQYRSPEAIARRNDQERVRQKEINDAFDQLRAQIPYGEWKGKKMSKCQTLEGAIEHIRNLATVIHEADAMTCGTQFTGFNNSYSLSPTSSIDMSQSGYSSPETSFSPSVPTHGQTYPSLPDLSCFYQNLNPMYCGQTSYLSEIPLLPTQEETPLDYSSGRYSPY